jgi:hypothetical protein
MKDKERKLEDVEAPHTLVGASDTLRYINLADSARGRARLRKPMDLRACLSERRGDREGVDSEAHGVGRCTDGGGRTHPSSGL